MKNIAKEINKSKVIAVLQIDLLENVMPLCEALLKQGINIIELALRTNVSQKATELILKNFPDILVGLGTVVHEDQVRFAVDTGVNFAVSPGCNTKIIDLALKNKLPFFPGISSPTDIEISIDHGCQILKFFPAENFGGINYLNSINAPYNHLNIKYIPLGGINLSNVKNYLESDIVLGVGGSWIAPRNLINEKKWDIISSNAKKIIDLISLQ
ncbi:MAG: keto-deoxy-phosphogluconate aldolase [Flavobacteriaceae bacterium]|nr:keto-deoxy-phosphogluconate aldolase [Flavobacteriaceae bacterium]|tara:strand:+ start:676 stop:1314 length:639 start_codon:yes stop_codon:yes gene_type:complete